MFTGGKWLAAAIVSIAFGSTAQAAVVDILGDQDFNDGDTPIYVTEFEGAADGDPDPFNVFSASDIGVEERRGLGWELVPTFGSISYTHTFSLNGDESHAVVEIGLFDHDSFEEGMDVIDIFFDGVAQDTSMWEGISVAQSSYHIRRMEVDLALLADGELRIDIMATGTGGGDPVDGVVWHVGNGIGVDFSKLLVDAPLPGAGLLMLAGLGALGRFRRKT